MEGYSMYQMYVDGGFFMHPILICLIIGLGICFERFWTLMRATIDTRQFLQTIKKALVEDGLETAVELCEKTRGPVAAIFHAGLLRAHRGIEHVEKAIMNAGAVEMAFLEKRLVWLNLFVSLAPMLGFLGTVQGMIIAFKAIEQANDVSPTIVAHGIAVALLTTLFGLAVAIVIQTAHNFFTSRIDKLVIDMEESSAELVDTLVELEYQAKIPLNQIGQA
ncbi:MAG: MotA/TolQ/ExbB proton channel family protein [candidate division KSB1 bacterium]|nr:MotA/TolQ/ExbB proton channel family protein [candidate division KSB1 bacterium]MDZ7364398.1 MotA/TolQ/ExbB proton channel family protein [candidate division KSB1 bacterium]MDZ7402770.1 MotA/TolQ/ExbB proton channel family protein [candidate division KSB1 bacterium]